MTTIFLDFETFYDKGYSLKSPKISMSEYIRDKRFMVHCVGWAVGRRPLQWCSGDLARKKLAELPWKNATLVCHNTAFDGYILSHHYGHVPKRYADTMLMSRAVYGAHVPHDLDSLAERLGTGAKIKGALADIKGKTELTEEEMNNLGEYCVNDVGVMASSYDILVEKVPADEMDLMHLTLQMFCDPVLRVDMERVKEALNKEVGNKVAKVMLAGVSADQLSSNDEFAALLERQGVTVPTKISPATKCETWALAKKDKAFLDLYEGGTSNIKAIIEARWAIKSTLGESRAERFLRAGEDDAKLPVLLQYCGAHTTRWSAGNRMNFQNLPRGGELRRSILAPADHVLVVVDSAQIEARVNLWMANDQEKLEVFRLYDEGKGPDLYRVTATVMFKKALEDITAHERFVGKVCTLALGFGMGPDKLKTTLATDQNSPVEITINEACDYVNTYRKFNQAIVHLWQEMEAHLTNMVQGEPKKFKAVSFDKNQIILPSGLAIHYHMLHASISAMTKRAFNASYQSRKGPVKLYGGILTENVVQALARCIVAKQMLEISKRYRVAFMTHDEVVYIAHKDEAEEALQFGLRTMKTPPYWAPDLPLNAEGGYAENYSK